MNPKDDVLLFQYIFQYLEFKTLFKNTLPDFNVISPPSVQKFFKINNEDNISSDAVTGVEFFHPRIKSSADHLSKSN